jgi:hypothetical protein
VIASLRPCLSATWSRRATRGTESHLVFLRVRRVGRCAEVRGRRE